MKESRREKECSSDRHKKKKIKKHKKRCKSSSSNDGESSDSEVEWVEASSKSETKTDKKNKKSKKKRKSRSSSSSDTDSASNHNQRLGNAPAHSASERESWMNEEMFVPTLSKEEMVFSSSSHKKRMDSLREQQENKEKIQQERELNPHWKNDGTGLPEKEADIDSLSLPSTSVGDGGYSYLKKAYYRVQEQAQKEGRSMEEVAVERWGSLAKLTSLIEEAETRMRNLPDHRRNYHRSRNEYEQHSQQSNARSFRKPYENEYESRHFDRSFEFKKPSDNNRKDKKLNQFVSSRKSYSYNYPVSTEKDQSESKDFSSNTRNSEKKTSYESECKDYKDSSSKKNRIPAWKKPKNSDVNHKQSSSVPETHISSAKVNREKSISDPEEINVMYSEEDLNKLAARQMKAEIMGNTSLALELKNQLEKARSIVKEKGFAQRPTKQMEEVILTKLDSQGQARPIQTTQEQISEYKHKKSNRGKYFDDGSKYSLKQMFEREKLTTADDQIEMFVEATAQCDDSAEIDFELGNVSKKLSQKMAVGRDEEKDIGKAMRQHQKLTAALEKCEYCLDQPRMKKFLIVDIGEQVYLSLPNYQTITEGHCLIVPKTHVSSFLCLDENEWREVDLFKNELRNMFRAQEKSVIFLETSMNFRYHPHAVLECIPVPGEEGSDAPIYFKKAIQESEAEWANNIKLIDLTKKGLRYSVPKNLPYFHVEFDPKVHAGFAHVIEEERSFPHNFGKEVLGGMLDIDFHQLYKNKKEDPLKKSKEVVEFEKMWKSFKNGDS